MNAVHIDKKSNRSGRLLTAVGLIWLLLAGALVIYLLLPAHVEISWETATEQGTAGFRLYRSQEEDGDFVLVNTDKIIESRGGPVSGAKYSYKDNDVEAGKTYYYVLEELESNGSHRRYENDIFEYEVPGVSRWHLVLVAICIVMGVVMLSAGIKEVRK